MRKYFTLATLLIITIVTITSCGSDSNGDDKILPITEGTWEVQSRKFNTNYEEFNKKINPYLFAELDTTTIKQFFESAFNYSEINTIRQSGATHTKTYNWAIKTTTPSSGSPVDSLFLINSFTEETVMKGQINITANTLNIDYKVDITTIKTILIDIYIDPNIADSYDNIQGTYNVRMKR